MTSNLAPGSGANNRGLRVDLLIEGGTVLTMKEDEPPLRDAVVMVSHGEIIELGKTGEVDKPSNTPAEVIDARDAIVMPGLVNAHVHGAMTLFRGLADDLPLRQWLFEKIFPAEAKILTPETVYWGSLLACLEMIASGTTCFADSYFFQDQTVRAAQEAGLRGVVAQGVLDFPAPGVEDPKRNIQVAKEFVDRWIGFSDLITPGVFCHSPLTCSSQTLKRAHSICLEYGLPFQIHVSETVEEVEEVKKEHGKRPVQYLDHLGLIDAHFVAVHAVHLNQKELERLKKKQAGVVHVPESNMKLASGVAKVPEMLKMGLHVGLGTDGSSSNNDLDLLCEMDSAAKLAKVFDSNPVILDASTVLRMGTTGGASVLGLDARIGTLEKGKRADIIIIDPKSPHLCPIYDYPSALVYCANGGDVRDVLVNGRILMRKGKFTTLDSAEILGKVKEISKTVMT
jgi:5-methylthioadenosine/S-adenosylhomocysteine deaminase